MSANVSIITGEAKDVLCVDNKALKFSPEDNTQKFEKQGIWILTPAGPKRYNVELGLSDDNKTQIISKEDYGSFTYAQNLMSFVKNMN